MLRSMYSGISGMKANQTKLDVIGNNIANVSTTGFKASSARFTDMLYQNSSSATAPTTNKGGTNANQVGLGAKLASINKVISQGNALATGRSLDVCVDGEGYLIVAGGNTSFEAGNTVDENGAYVNVTNSINYTRDGNLTLDKDGNLLTSNGLRVMGYLYTDTETGNKSLDQDGKAYYVDPDAKKDDGTSRLEAVKDGNNFCLTTLRIPTEVITSDPGVNPPETQPVASFSIGKDGLITAVLGNGSLTVLGQIATATFKNPEGLTDKGGNLLSLSANSGDAIIRNPSFGLDQDNTGGFGDLIQGCLEASNVDLTEQFTDMITATRAFQASSKMISTADEILQTITSLM